MVHFDLYRYKCRLAVLSMGIVVPNATTKIVLIRVEAMRVSCVARRPSGYGYKIVRVRKIRHQIDKMNAPLWASAVVGPKPSCA